MNGLDLDLTLYTAPTPAELPLVFTITPDVVAGIGGYRVDWVLNKIRGWTMAHPEESIQESIAHDIEEQIANSWGGY